MRRAEAGPRKAPAFHALVSGSRVFQACFRMLPVGALLGFCGIGIARAQQGLASPTPEPPTPISTLSFKPGQYVGYTTCGSSNCHGSPVRLATYDVFQNEVTTWLKSDRHRAAFAVLKDTNKRSTQIARNLHLERKPSESPRCLVCHAMLPSSGSRAFQPESGISCEGCHGPSGGWVNDHKESTWSHSDSVKRGMYDLRDLATRTRTCLRCHLGSADGQVDHELLAAGHPELIFELDSFTDGNDLMPVHWTPFEQLRDKGRRRTHGARAWVVGEVESLRQTMLQASRQSSAGVWPEFSVLTCEACHHDLSMGKWRQERGYPGHAGYPPLSPARWTAVRTILAVLAPASLPTIEPQMDAAARAFSEPGVSTVQLRDAVDRVASGLEQVASSIDVSNISTQQLREMIDRISTDKGFLARADRQSAMQVAYSLESLVHELADISGKPESAQTLAWLDKLFEDLPDHYDRDKFVKALKAKPKDVP